MIDEDIVFGADDEAALTRLTQTFPDVLITLKRVSTGYFCRLGLTTRLPKCDATRIRPTIKEALDVCRELLHDEHPFALFPVGSRVELAVNWRCWGSVQAHNSDRTATVRWFNWSDRDPPRDVWAEEIRPAGTRVNAFPNDDMFIEAVGIHMAERLQMLKECGAIYDYDHRGPIAEPVKFSIAELGESATMANVMVAMKLMPSLSQARRNGWDKPLELGVHSLTKKKILVEIIP